MDRAWCVGGGIWVGPNMTCVSEYLQEGGRGREREKGGEGRRGKRKREAGGGKDSVDRAWCAGGGTWVGPSVTCVSEYLQEGGRHDSTKETEK